MITIKQKKGEINNNKKANAKAITKRSADYSKWYQDVIEAAGLAEHASVRGCMIIKPYGYAIWENIQGILDKLLKDLGVQNAYFPLFIPESFLKKETEHIKGFSPELAVVAYAGGKKLEEPLVVRPTSETIIYESFSKWIQSYRDLPVIINQWANVVRWELRPRLFLRTTEFLWQEGHTAHANPEEAEEYARMILIEVYKKFAEEYLAMPVYTGKKSEGEKFAGAKQTFCIEALMQDGKSLQVGTSHDLSDNFARSFDVMFLDKDENKKYVYQSSWGVSTRLIGGIIMIHSDDYGLILPPKIAPIQIVIIPISFNKDNVINETKKIYELLSKDYRVKFDDRPDLRPGEKYYEWEKKGVPLRIEIGPRDLSEKKCILVRRDKNEKVSCRLDDVKVEIKFILEDIHNQLFKNALERRENTNIIIDDWEEFKIRVEKGGYIFAYWCEDEKCEAIIKQETKATTRCLPFDYYEEKDEHFCVHCGKKTPSKKRWIFARAY